MAAQVVRTLPEGSQWLYEVTVDGYRALILKRGGHFELIADVHATKSRIFGVA